MKQDAIDILVSKYTEWGGYWDTDDVDSVCNDLLSLKPYIELAEIFTNPKYQDQEYLQNDGIDDIVENLLQKIKERK